MKEIRIIYFMDPICSYCWGLSSILRRLNLEYGDQFTIETHMGGLMPPGGFDKSDEEYMSNEDLAKLWDEVGDHIPMPINGKVWMETPLDSSFVAGIAYKSAIYQDVDKANKFLRLLQEKLFVESLDISNIDLVCKVAEEVGLDSKVLRYDYDSRGKEAFNKDLELLHKLEVQLFPTLFFYNSKGQYKAIDNLHAYTTYEKALYELKPNLEKRTYVRDASILLNYFGSMTINDLVVLLDISVSEAQEKLDTLLQKGLATRLETKGGSLWRAVI